MKALFILNGAPYGDERTYNGLRLAGALARRDHHELRVFLLGDAVSAAKNGQRVAEGFYNLELMLGRVTHVATSAVHVCGTCMDARGIKADELIEGIRRGTLDELADWSEWADKVLVF
ncbi:hypothetical protein EPN42_15470 [bacterium]|nr:MAG: hypothetical protein EPN42_15470 [bacterium]